MHCAITHSQLGKNGSLELTPDCNAGSVLQTQVRKRLDMHLLATTTYNKLQHTWGPLEPWSKGYILHGDYK